ncbi:hypothetical protein [Microbacterium sp. YJN-G]
MRHGRVRDDTRGCSPPRWRRWRRSR